ncbi:MAG: hypothetical protein FJZ01_09400 [Candidatus Sericytochromatia bacterium]|nr:hypothetical protein [Candidatus Tanganyikabacteria bacterium]
MRDTASFQRDLGYLAKFLAGLRTHAADLPPAARERLLALLDEEDASWREITALLGAAAPLPNPAAPDATAPGRPAGRPAATPGGLTVGSLLGS